MNRTGSGSIWGALHLGDQLRIDHRSWQRGVVSLCSGRLSVAYYLRCFFVILPTTNIRPSEVGTGLSGVLMSFMQGIDAPTNLFPSIHCLVSWFCFAAIRGNDKIPKWYRVLSGVFAVLVCASTQFTKQHYLIDVLGAVVISEGCLYFGRHTECYQLVQHIFERLDHKIFGESEVITEDDSSKN